MSSATNSGPTLGELMKRLEEAVAVANSVWLVKSKGGTVCAVLASEALAADFVANSHSGYYSEATVQRFTPYTVSGRVHWFGKVRTKQSYGSLWK